MNIIIGDGDNLKRDRALLFSSEFTKVSMATGTHSKKSNMQVIGFAQEYIDNVYPTITIEQPGYPWTVDELEISFMEANCENIQLTDNSESLSLSCTLPTNPDNDNKVIAVAGDWLPKVHFKSIGYAMTTGLVETVLEPEISITSTIGSENGGLIFTIPGSNFGYSLDNSYETSVTIGGEPCVLKSLTNTEITCETPGNTDDDEIIVSVNGKTVTDETSLTTAAGLAIT